LEERIFSTSYSSLLLTLVEPGSLLVWPDNRLVESFVVHPSFQMRGVRRQSSAFAPTEQFRLPRACTSPKRAADDDQRDLHEG